MKYAIVLAIVISVYSFSQCYRFLAYKEVVGGMKALYCSVSFFHLFPRSFSALDFFVHLFVWIVLSIVVYRIYLRYLGGKIF
jgi:ABC-type microcin C transport system permease subunit YejE